ncbi:hypothetical protein BCT42_14575 [Vibrio lentus]|uniref:hypothetical protein n=1 Tax=Vibrio TaxID=662 RepID=UPI00062FB639|nr:MULTISPECIES: hypothetical protein [Vibrio]PML43438.1 hypothetical protein BCT75_06140 [Vibrio lentus]PMN04837.1 hypothetical protein BCT42_14575 [Vibrio lentus]CDT85897.1 conserved hypothetical protein [Vibrio coralliirubri]
MKIYAFSSKQDYIFYLSQIIADTIKYKERLKRYLKEIDELVKTSGDSKVIDAVLYESVSDKSKAILYYLFNLLGDESKGAVSYRKFRKLLVKGSPCLGVVFEKLNSEETQVSNSFNRHRNWGLHIPESLLTNEREMHEITGAVIDENMGTIPLEVYEYFDIKYLTSLQLELKDVVSSVEVLEERMMQDYLKLVGVDFQVSFYNLKVKPYAIMEVVQASFDTQTKKRKPVV